MPVSLLRRALAPLVAALVFAVPAAAWAAPIDVTMSGPQLTLTGLGSDDLVKLTTYSAPTITDRTLVFESPSTFTEALPDCTLNGAATEIKCDHVPASPAQVFLGAGSDQFEVTATGVVPVVVFGEGGHDVLTGGEGADMLFGGADDDVLDGRDGDDELDGYVGAGNPSAGADAGDTFFGGRGADVLYDTGASANDTINFFGDTPARIAGVSVTFDGQANDGNGTYDAATSGPIGGRDSVGTGIDYVQGTNSDDVLVGDAQANKLSGAGGNDAVTGGDGHDELFGGDGDDTVNARDGDDDTADLVVNCGNGIPGTGDAGDVANVDRADPAPVDCATVNRFSPSSGGGGGGTTPPPSGGDGTTAPPAPAPKTAGELTAKTVVAALPEQELKFPNYLRGTKLCGKKKYCKAPEMKTSLDRKKLNIEFSERKASGSVLEDAVGRKVVAGEVLKTSPKAGTKVKSGPGSAIEVKAYVFEPSKIAGCNLNRPYVRIEGELFKLTDYIRDMTLARAEKVLREAGCPRDRYDLVTKVKRGADRPTVATASITGSSQKKLRLVVHHGSPEITFALTKPKLVSGFLPAMWGDNNELVLPAGEKFTLYVNPTKAGIGFSRLYVNIYGEDGGTDVWGQTKDNGIADVSGQIAKPGKYELWSQLCDKEGDCIVGWKRLDVAKLDTRRTYVGIDGLTYGHSKGDWKPVANAAARARAAQADRASLGKLAAQIVTDVARSPLYREAAKRDPNGPLYSAVLTLNAAAGAAIGKGDAGYYDALVARGAEITVLAGAGNGPTTISAVDFVKGKAVYSDGTRSVTVPTTAINPHDGAIALKVGNFMFLPGGLFYPVTGGGTTAGATQKLTPVSAAAPNLDLTKISGATAIGLLGAGTAPLIGMDGATLIGNDAGSLIGMDGGSLIGMDGATLIGMDGASLVGMDGGTLIGMDGGSLIGMDGATVISTGGNG